MIPTVAQIAATDPRYANLTERFEFVAHSWFQQPNADMLSVIIDSLQPKRILEVGTWMGASARFFAGKPSVEEVVCVDHWDRHKAENYTPGVHPEEWLDNMYEHFLANCLHAGLGTAVRIRPLRMESLHAAERLKELKWEGRFDLVYIDGAHKTEAVEKDLVAFRPFVRQGGIYCGDDWAHKLPGEDVRGAVKRYAETIKATAIGYGNFWWLNF